MGTPRFTAAEATSPKIENVATRTSRVMSGVSGWTCKEKVIRFDHLPRKKKTSFFETETYLKIWKRASEKSICNFFNGKKKTRREKNCQETVQRIRAGLCEKAGYSRICFPISFWIIQDRWCVTFMDLCMQCMYLIRILLCLSYLSQIPCLLCASFPHPLHSHRGFAAKTRL